MFPPPPSFSEDDWDSDEEDGIADQNPLDLTWVTIQEDYQVCISSLPGNRLGGARRSVPADIETIKKEGIQHVFVLCTNSELRRAKIPQLLDEYKERGLKVHHYTMDEDGTPGLAFVLHLVVNLHKLLQAEKKVLIHCVDGCGRSCLITALYGMILDSSLSPLNAIEWMRRVRGPAAVQTIKQYNFIMEQEQLIETVRRHILEYM